METIKKFITSVGHAVAYGAGIMVGLVVGMRNPIKKDKSRFDAER
jgi:hypothetical protein